VALVLADLWMPDMTGIELLTKVHALDPAAKRALLTGWGDLQVGDRLVRAAVLGQVDDWGLKPWQPGDEGFHQLVVGLLYEWAQLYRPGFQAVQVVAEQWSARAHELRDLLARNKVLYGFRPADSEEGRAAGAGRRNHRAAPGGGHLRRPGPARSLLCRGRRGAVGPTPTRRGRL
jgi:thioredoxin reductase (NADPH)